jgi:hypothetical protein
MTIVSAAGDVFAVQICAQNVSPRTRCNIRACRPSLPCIPLGRIRGRFICRAPSMACANITRGQLCAAFNGMHFGLSSLAPPSMACTALMKSRRFGYATTTTACPYARTASKQGHAVWESPPHGPPVQLGWVYETPGSGHRLGLRAPAASWSGSGAAGFGGADGPLAVGTCHQSST